MKFCDPSFFSISKDRLFCSSFQQLPLFMATEDENSIQERYGEYRNSKTALVLGVRMPPFYVKGFKDFIENFQTRHDDIFIVGFPRSGTTWLQEVTWQICNDGEVSQVPIGHRVQFFDEAKFPHTTQPDITTRPSPCLIKSHQPFPTIPEGTCKESRCKYIYVARNPLDAVVSFIILRAKWRL